ncbi:hypothetical protein F4782DRAFT_551071 [Xylaria castorea]|nr:hypothetical protein F4782DRAFT_551071 [Xylaria castorea]
MMHPIDVWVICLLGTLEALHFLRFLRNVSATSTSTTTTVIWTLWVICTGIVAAALTMEGLMAMSDHKPNMKLGLPVVIAFYVAHFSIMPQYFTDNACVHISRFLDRAITLTWIVAQAEYRWAVCTTLAQYMS